MCLFCGQQTEEGKGRQSCGKHVGQYMEEIALLVVPKEYKEWEFYLEDSPAPSVDPGMALAELHSLDIRDPLYDEQQYQEVLGKIFHIAQTVQRQQQIQLAEKYMQYDDYDNGLDSSASHEKATRENQACEKDLDFPHLL